MQEYVHEYADHMYYTPGRLDMESRIWPVRGGRSEAKPTYAVGPKRIECCSVHAVCEGRLLVEYGGTERVLGPGDLFCLFPGQTYSYRLAPGGGRLRLLWLAVDGSGAETLLAETGLTVREPYICGRGLFAAIDAIDMILQEMSSADRRSVRQSLKLQSLLYEWILLMSEGMRPTEAAVAPSDWIRTSSEYMALHACEGITVRQAAEHAGFARTYFSTAFARQTGMTPFDYLQKIRMDKARELLRDTTASITEIAMSVGYPSLYAFTRAFKTCYAVSPIQYRKAGQG